MAFFTIFWTLFCSIGVLAIIYATGKKEKANWFVTKIWAQIILTLSGVKVELRGEENLPPGGFLYLFNHVSHYDIFVMFAGSPRFFHFGAKSELFAIPVFGAAIRKAGALPIERKNREKVMKVYKEAEARVKKGDVFALAPEGTRGEGNGKLADFKSGPFYFAVNAQMPMVPMVVIGCERVLPKHALFANWGKWQQTVILEILKPVYPQGTSEEQIPQLRAQLREQMQACLDKYYK